MKNLLFIPTYNCEKQIVRVLCQLTPDIISHFNEIIIFDNQSSDRTVEVAQSKILESNLPIEIKINTENVNLGGTHKLAFFYAIKNEFDYCFILHGDDQANVADFKWVLESKKYCSDDLILGSRFSFNSERINYSKLRTIGNIFFNCLVSLRYLKIVPDFGGSGLNGFKVKFLKDNIVYHFDDYDNDLTFHTYLLMKALSLKAKIFFVPISWREFDQKSNVKLISQSMKLLRIISREKV